MYQTEDLQITQHASLTAVDMPEVAADDWVSAMVTLRERPFCIGRMEQVALLKGESYFKYCVV